MATNPFRIASTSDLLTGAQGARAGSDAPDGWVGAPIAWDTVRVAGEVLPGAARVEVSRKYELDKKRTAGADGATLTGFGHMPADVTITIRMWTDEQFQRMKNLLPTIMPRPKKGRPVPVDVSHPGLAFQGVRSLYFMGINGPKATGTPGLFELVLQASEYLPVANANVTFTPTQSAATGNALLGINTGGSGNLPQPPVNPLDQLLSTGILPPSQDSTDTGP